VHRTVSRRERALVCATVAETRSYRIATRARWLAGAPGFCIAGAAQAQDAAAGTVPALDLVSALVGAAVVSIVIGVILFVRSAFGGRPRTDGTETALATTLLREYPGAMLTWVGREIRFFCGDHSPFAEIRQDGAAMTMTAVGSAFTETDGVRLQDAAVRLRESGRSVDLRLSGREEEADFLAIGRRITSAGESLDAIWFVDISELARRTRKQQREIEALNHAHRAVVGLLDSLAFPAWVRAPDLQLTYVNPAYARAVDQRDAASAVREQREIGAGLLEDRTTLIDRGFRLMEEALGKAPGS